MLGFTEDEVAKAFSTCYGKDKWWPSFMHFVGGQQGLPFTDLRYKPPRTGVYWVICGDGQIRKAKYVRRKGEQSGWKNEGGYEIPDTWKYVRGWAPLELDMREWMKK